MIGGDFSTFMILMVAAMAGREGMSCATAATPSIPRTGSADLAVPLLAHSVYWPQLVVAQARVRVVAQPKLDPPTSTPQYLDIVA